MNKIMSSAGAIFVSNKIKFSINSTYMNKFLISSVIFYSCIMGCTNKKNKTLTNDNNLMELNLHFDTSLNNAQQQMRKESNKMILTSTKETDYFIEPGGA